VKFETMAQVEQHLDGLPKAAEVRMAAIVELLTKPIDDLIHSAGGIEKFCDKLDELYDKYIAPQDVPFVPDEFEDDLIDNPLKALMRATARRFHEAIHKVPVL